LVRPDFAAGDLVDLGDRLSAAGRPGWRVEVTRRGKFWQWRTGSKAQRRARYGGKFSLLSDERKAQYEINKARRQVKAQHRAD
jgi:hypothetical protein